MINSVVHIFIFQNHFTCMKQEHIYISAILFYQLLIIFRTGTIFLNNCSQVFSLHIFRIILYRKFKLSVHFNLSLLLTTSVIYRYVKILIL